VTGTPPTLTCGTPITVADGTASGQYGTVSTSAPSCQTNEKYTYADIYQVTYQPGMVIDVDCEGLLGFLEVLSADGCTSYNCGYIDASGINIEGESFVQDANSQNGVLRFTIGLDDIGLTAGDTYLIKYTSIANCGGSPCTSATVGTTRGYTISCHTTLANSCENAVVMSGGTTYSITNQYTSDNGADLNGAGLDCGFSIENNLMYRWCTDESNTQVDVQIANLSIESGTSVQFAILSDDCGGDFTDIQCNSGLSTDQTIPITGTVANTCYWISFDGNAGTWFTADVTLIDAILLPIELVELNAQKGENYTQLTWITASEINNNYFSIERSLDGDTWEEIGTVKGAGNSNVYLTYGFTDSSPVLGDNYYRLRQFDFDGKNAYSYIVSVRFDEIQEVEIEKCFDITGREVDIYYNGPKIIKYKNGLVKRGF
jgi:hypothetical protein